MAHYSCIIQEGQSPDQLREKLEEGLRQIGREFFGDDPQDVEIRWNRFAKGWAWTAGELSTSSVVIRSVPVGYDNEEREKFLRSVCDLWVETTGCSINEIVATAYDGPVPI